MFNPSTTDKLVVLRLASEDVSRITELLRDRMSVVGVMTPLVYQTMMGPGVIANVTPIERTKPNHGAISPGTLQKIKDLFISGSTVNRPTIFQQTSLNMGQVDRGLKVLVDVGFLTRLGGGRYRRTQSVTGCISEPAAAVVVSPTNIDSAARIHKNGLIDELRAAVSKLYGLEEENAKSLLSQWGRKHFLTHKQWQLVHTLLTYARTGKGSGAVAA